MQTTAHAPVDPPPPIPGTSRTPAGGPRSRSLGEVLGTSLPIGLGLGAAAGFIVWFVFGTFATVIGAIGHGTNDGYTEVGLPWGVGVALSTIAVVGACVTPSGRHGERLLAFALHCLIGVAAVAVVAIGHVVG